MLLLRTASAAQQRGMSGVCDGFAMGSAAMCCAVAAQCCMLCVTVCGCQWVPGARPLLAVLDFIVAPDASYLSLGEARALLAVAADVGCRGWLLVPGALARWTHGKGICANGMPAGESPGY
jgi:hypothetical protein